MAKPFDVLFANLANNLLTNFGKSITLQTVVEGAFNPATGDVTKTPTNLTINARVDFFDNNQIDGTYIQVGDVNIIMEATNIITKNDNFIIDGVTYDVVNFKKTYAQDNAVIYEVQARTNAT